MTSRAHSTGGLAHASVHLLLALLGVTACHRDLYLGHDSPSLGSAERAGAPAQPAQPQTSDAGAAPVPEQTVEAPVTEPTQPPPPPAAMTMASSPVGALSCDPGRADCDGQTANGCEVDLTQDREHCGSCGRACQTDDCRCDNGQLTLVCADGHDDCDGELDNGCEADLNNSMEHCGACQRRCHAEGHDAVEATCVAGSCEIMCEPRISPEADCDGDPDNGCESYLMFDRSNCGECGKTCRTNCEAGLCML